MGWRDEFTAEELDREIEETIGQAGREAAEDKYENGNFNEDFVRKFNEALRDWYEKERGKSEEGIVIMDYPDNDGRSYSF